MLERLEAACQRYLLVIPVDISIADTTIAGNGDDRLQGKPLKPVLVVDVPTRAQRKLN